ncbi:MAG: sodium/solute symporter [Phycisphaerae bacterium]
MEKGQFLFLDWIILIVYLVGMVLIGLKLAGKQTTTKEYFKADKQMHWFPVSLSVIATLFSGVSFIGQPARVFRYDTALIAFTFSVILITPIVNYVLLPFYSKLDVTTAYEYLEKRFSLNVRLVASALFILRRLFWMALVALAPSLALSAMTGIKVEYCILIIGVIATIYASLGGTSAVIWTDVIQFVIFMAGQVIIICFVAGKLDGGFGEIWRVGLASGDKLPSMDFDFSRLTFWTMLIAGCALALSDLGADQLTVQRLMAAKDLRRARISMVFNALWKIPSMTILLGMGVALWAFYKEYPHLLKLDPKEYDKIVPYFVINELPVGISGLVIAAIFSAAMSSFSSGLNCLVTTFTVDWYKRLLKPAQEDKQYLVLAKGLSFVLGVSITILAVLFYRTGIESIIDKSNEYLGYFGGALLGIFLLGVFTRRTKALPTVLASILTVALLFALNYYQSGRKSFIIHPYMYCFLGAAMTMILGYMGSLFGPELPFEGIRNYTLAGKRQITSDTISVGRST